MKYQPASQPPRNESSQARLNWLAPITLALGACSSGPTADWNSIRGYIDKNYPALESLTPTDLAQRMADPQTCPILVDARQEDEYLVSHIDGAILVGSRSSIATRLRECLDPESPRPIVVYCSVGVRSASVATQLQLEGFSQVMNLDGSIFQWANQDLPMVTEGGPTTKVHPYNEEWGKLLKREHWSFGHSQDDE